MGLGKNNFRKGFFLTLAVLVILTFMITSISLWNVVVRTKEEKAPVRFQAESLQEIGKSFSNSRITHVAEIIDYRAVHDLDWHIRYSGVYAKNISTSLEKFVLYGRCYPHDINEDNQLDIDGSTFQSLSSGCYSVDPAFWVPGRNCLQFDLNDDNAVNGKDAECFLPTNRNATRDTFNYWESTTRSLAEQAGFKPTAKIENFSTAQIDPWNVSVSYKVKINISDGKETMGIEKEFLVVDNFSIEGLEDPLIGVESWKTGDVPRPGVEKQIFRGQPYTQFVSRVSGTASIARGKGWTYGTSKQLNENTNPNETNRIFIGNAPPADPSPYAGFVLLKSPRTTTRVGGNATGSCTYSFTAPCQGNANATCTGQFSVSKTCSFYFVTENSNDCFDCYEWSPGCAVFCENVPLGNVTPANATPGSVRLLTPNQVVAKPREPARPIKSDGSGTKPYVQFSDKQANFTPPSTFDNRFLFVMSDLSWIVNNTIDPLGFDQFLGDGIPTGAAFTTLSHTGEVRFYDIENLRDYGVCSSYRETTLAPSFFARLQGTRNVSFDSNGIESFIVGQWTVRDNLSQVDWEYYSNITGITVRGMPGCKSNADCIANVPLGHFTLSTNALSRYGAVEIACPLTGFGAKCGVIN
ncbi:hypothetical protein HY570_02950 [Candidatus Micrarchaeota archaeon]|nr:hypothetical protein [Candidatus Micrarchaeota archaeon]